jgi:tetratricopeptide (TPR) repeat protein
LVIWRYLIDFHKIFKFACKIEKEGFLEEAREIFEAFLDTYLHGRYVRGEAHFYLGCIYKKMGEIKKARHHFEECLKFTPDNEEGWKALKSIYLQEGRADELEEKFKEVLSLHKDKVDVRCKILIQRGAFYSEQKRYKEAEKTFNKALSLNTPPNTKTSIHYALASLYERKGNLERAEKKFEEVIKSGGRIPSFVGGVHFHLGCIHKRRGEIEEARHHFEECLKFIPGHKKAKDNLERIMNLKRNEV